MTAPDPRLGEIEARLAEHYEDIAYADDIPEGGDEEVPEDYERHYCNEDGEDWPCQTITHAAPADVAYLLAELRRRDEALAAVLNLCDQTEKGRPQETDCPENWMLDPEDVRDAITAVTGGQP